MPPSNNSNAASHIGWRYLVDQIHREIAGGFEKELFFSQVSFVLKPHRTELGAACLRAQ